MTGRSDDAYPDPDTTDSYQTDNIKDIVELTHGDGPGVPDRDDTGGGPRGGNTTDGRTGPGKTGAQGAPDSTLRVQNDGMEGGQVKTHGGDELRPLGGWQDGDHETAAQRTLEGEEG